MLDIAQGFIAYQDEEHGLGHKAAQNLAMYSVKGLQPTRRQDTNATLSEVAGSRAEKAVIPLERDGVGYDIAALESLIDYNQTLNVTQDVIEEDNYCLAVPSSLVHEIAQSAHPGSFGENGAVNLAKMNKKADAPSFKFSLKKRLDAVYVTEDSLRRCAPAIEALRADGVEIFKIDDRHDIYREVLKIARQMLDPERIIKTSFDDNKHVRTSETKGTNYAKTLIGVLLPLEIASGGTRNIVEIRDDGRKVLQGPDQYLDGDYYPIIDNMAIAENLKSRFVIAERRPKSAIVKKDVDLSLPKLLLRPKRHKLIEKIDRLFTTPQGARRNTFRVARLLLKFDTRGAHVGNFDDITKVFKKARIPFVPVYLHKDKEKLPVVLEVEIKQGTAYERALEAVFRLANIKSRNHNFMVLGVYGSDSCVFDHDALPAVAQTPELPLWVKVAVFTAILSSSTFAYLLVTSRLGT